MNDFTTSVLVDASPTKVFDAICSPREWWGRTIEGDTSSLGGEWTYRYKHLHFSRQRTTVLEPGKRVVWHVVESDLSFLKDRSEWNGTELVFDIAPQGDKTLVRFTHAGLVPSVECYGACTGAWTGLIQDSLTALIETGQGLPDTVEKDAA